MARMYFGKTLMSPHTVDEKEVAKTKLGASIDTWIGDIDENGTLNQTTWTGALNFSGVKTVGNSALYRVFCDCTNITSVDLSSVQSIGNSGLNHAFDGCTGITSIDLSSLQSVGSNGLGYAFGGCTSLIAISFPSLTSVQTNSFSGAFNNCTNLTEIHFRAGMETEIEACTGYSSKFGAPSATIYFDL